MVSQAYQEVTTQLGDQFKPFQCLSDYYSSEQFGSSQPGDVSFRATILKSLTCQTFWGVMLCSRRVPYVQFAVRAWSVKPVSRPVQPCDTTWAHYPSMIARWRVDGPSVVQTGLMTLHTIYVVRKFDSDVMSA